MGLGRKDDSQVVRVYESVTGVPVGQSKILRAEGDGIGDLWKMEDGREEEIMEVGEEPRHKIVISNDYVRALRVSFPPNDTTFAHRHAEDSIYFFSGGGRTRCSQSCERVRSVVRLHGIWRSALWTA